MLSMTKQSISQNFPNANLLHMGTNGENHKENILLRPYRVSCDEQACNQKQPASRLLTNPYS